MRRRIRIFIQQGLGIALVAWGAHPALARVARPEASKPKASIAVGPAAPAAVGRRVPTDLAARLLLQGAGPHPMIRVLEGDRVALTIVNSADSGSARTVSFPGLVGGGDLNAGPIPPGEKSEIEFVADHPGLHAYRVRSGDAETSGLLLIEPVYGFRRAEREFFVLIGDEGAFAGEEDLAAEPGDRIRLFLGNGGPGPVASLSFDGQVKEAGIVQDGLSSMFDERRIDLQAGATAILELEVGETGEIGLQTKIDGRDGPRGVIRVEVVEVVEEETTPVAAEGVEMTPELAEKLAAGKEVYGRTCIACHQATGLGIPGVYPPLAESDYLLADVDRAILGVIEGQQGEITVNGATYNMFMPPQLLNDEEIAQVMTYVMNSFGNPGEDVTVDRVKAIREKAQ